MLPAGRAGGRQFQLMLAQARGTSLPDEGEPFEEEMDRDEEVEAEGDVFVEWDDVNGGEADRAETAE